jgi:hypothetical protein
MVGDRIGRRRLLLIGAAAFGTASVLAAFAASGVQYPDAGRLDLVSAGLSIVARARGHLRAEADRRGRPRPAGSTLDRCPRDEHQHLSLAGCELLEQRCRWLEQVGAGGEVLDQPARDRGGEQSLTALDNVDRLEEALPGGASLSRKPAAPARRAPKTYSSRSKVVNTSTGGGGSIPAAVSRAVASTPFVPGMRMSIRTTSGLRQHRSVRPLGPDPGSRRHRRCRSDALGGPHRGGRRRVDRVRDHRHSTALHLLFAADLGLLLPALAQ